MDVQFLKGSIWTKTVAHGNTTLLIAIQWTFNINNNMVHRASRNTELTSKIASLPAASTITLWMIANKT